MNVSPDSAKRVCKGCLSTNEGTALFCNQCGRPLIGGPAPGSRPKAGRLAGSLVTVAVLLAAAFVGGYETGSRRASPETPSDQGGVELHKPPRDKGSPAGGATPEVEALRGTPPVVENDIPPPPEGGARAPEPEVQGVVLIEGTDAEGEAIAPGLGVAVGEGILAVPEDVLLGAHAAKCRSGTGEAVAIKTVKAYDQVLGLVLAGVEPGPPPLAIHSGDIRAGDTRSDAVTWPPSAAVVPCLFEGAEHDAVTGGSRLKFSGTPPLRRGAVMISGEAVLGVVPPAADGGSQGVLAIPVTAVKHLLATSLDQSLADFTAAHFDGTGKAFLRAGLKAYRAGRYAQAIAAFRDAISRDRSLRPIVVPKLEDAHRGVINGIADSGRDDDLVVALRNAIGDLPSETEFRLMLARVLRRARFFTEAIEAYKDLAAADGSYSVEANEAGRGIYAEWARWLSDQGNHQDAVRVLTEALRFYARDPELLELLGRAYLRLRLYAEAAAAWRNAVAADPSREGELAARIAGAERLADGPGKVVIDYTPHARSIPADAILNGRATGKFLIDTGATITWVSPAAARAAGVNITAVTPRVKVTTAGNERELPYVTLDSLSVGSLTVTDIAVIVGDIPGFGSRGLLGMDFLGKFSFENDAEAGRFVITRK